ncbi:efflux RND transporter periplasmic adaptor subunit [Lacibacter luteus]|uniref:Efflux RND transporter periplasmic adaptor subunit n=1 Tax=Lacibacter luteus TaxID=2508719 RepID=A0A4Q1CHV7_9BACT|nr:efflux RND transporter periplasmic adaptor subunit [Lacibacter luteus]RXK59938.1 efflux RND transporter periplasmic adaptor subunit [Lacibacter luteus]
MKKNSFVKIITGIVILAAAVASIAWVLKHNKAKNKAKTDVVAQAAGDVSVKTGTVENLALDLDFAVNGNFAPWAQMDFAAESSGRVVKLLADEGTYVKVGQTLAIVDAGVLNVDLESAQTVLDNAVRDQQRFENAFKTGGVTQQQLDQARLAVENAKARVAQSKIRVGDANVHATINGVVNKRYVEPGAYVTPGSKLFELVDVSKLKLAVTVSEGQVAQLKIGDTVQVKVSVFPDKNYRGRVTFIAAKADASLNFPVEIELASNPGNQLRAGMYGTAVFRFGNQTKSLVVPRTAFAGSVSSNQVFVVGSDNVARIRKVIAGRIMGDKVQILEGVNEGETVIISGQINLVDGSKVALIK